MTNHKEVLNYGYWKNSHKMDPLRNLGQLTAWEIPIDSISPVGFVYDETEVTAWQDAVKGYLRNHPDAPIDITGPWDNSAAAALAASGLAPTLSGSHTVLSALAAPGGTALPRGLWIAIGVRGYWTAAVDPAFGVAAPSATSGYVLTKYTVEGESNIQPDLYRIQALPQPGNSDTSRLCLSVSFLPPLGTGVGLLPPLPAPHHHIERNNDGN